MIPLLNTHTAKMLQVLTDDLPQAVLLSGDGGVGLGTIARYLAAEQQIIPSIILPEKNDKIDLDKGNIPIDAIRELYLQTRTKRRDKRIIIIDYAERMSKQAQNAFLKLLEEPNESTHFILATHAPERLIPTVLSRIHQLEVRHISEEQSSSLLDTLSVKDPTKRTQILFMATGLPAEMKRLVEHDEYFEKHSTLMRNARDLLQADAYTKLLVAQRYKDDREGALQLLLYGSRIVRRTMSAKPTAQLADKATRLMNTYEQVAANGNIRLCLAQLVV